MSEQQMAQDVDDSFDGKGGWQSSGHEPTPLIDTFYDEQEIFDNWFGDAVTDCDECRMAVIRTSAVVIRGMRLRLGATAQRGDWEVHANIVSELAEKERQYGRMLFDLMNDYMVEASERCK